MKKIRKNGFSYFVDQTLEKRRNDYAWATEISIEMNKDAGHNIAIPCIDIDTRRNQQYSQMK